MSEGGGIVSQNSEERSSPGISKTHSNAPAQSARECWISCMNPVRLCWITFKSEKLSIQKEKRSMHVKCHRTISAFMRTKRLKAFHPGGKTLCPCIYLYSGCYGFFKCPYRAVSTSSTSPLWRTSPGGAWLHWWACKARLRALFLLPGEWHPQKTPTWKCN